MIKNFLNKHSDFGILLLRLGVGLAFIFVYGWSKITSGPDLWLKLGPAIGNLGIHFAPVFWGFMSALTEFGGGILITLGLFTRTAAFFMAFNMIVAALHHLKLLDPWYKVITPVEMLAVFLCLIFIGAGKYSVDNFLFKKK